HVLPAPTPGAAQRSLFQDYTAVLSTLAARQPLLLLLDDLHWASESTIRLLAHLAGRLAASPILVLGAYRPEELNQSRDGGPHPLLQVALAWQRQWGDLVVDLDRAAPRDGRDFIDAWLDQEPNTLDEGFRAELAHWTGGHALFTIELVQALRARGAVRPDAHGQLVVACNPNWEILPPRVESVIANRIDRLDTALRAVLTVASIEGETFTAEVVAQILGLDAYALVRRLSGELDRQHRLVAAAGTQRVGAGRASHYRFRHILFQTYLYHHQDATERAYQHEAVGEALAGLYAATPGAGDEIAGELARHFAAAGLMERALPYLQQAGAVAYTNAYAEALAFTPRPGSRRRPRARDNGPARPHPSAGDGDRPVRHGRRGMAGQARAGSGASPPARTNCTDGRVAASAQGELYS
ncbi:MAG: hypothetical protein WCD37_13260, partial [Chloroflexia bacterium]